MSWLVSSIANSLRLDDDEDDGVAQNTISVGDNKPPPPSQKPTDDQQNQNNPPIGPSPSSSPSDQSIPPRGVKEDLSEFSKTFTRQLWGVASFLAPPPQITSDPNDASRTSQFSQSEEADLDDSQSNRIAGIRSDLSEIGGKFRTGISKLSTNKAVSEFSKIASNFLQIGSEGDGSVEDYADSGVVGVTEEVLAFARDIAMHPETWLDFPLPDDDEEEAEDFELSDAQQEHALAVEHLAPRLAALRMEFCPGYMSEGSFWKIYFVLVHPRLSRQDAELLSTPEILKARAMSTQELQSRDKPKVDESVRGNDFVDATNSAHEEGLSIPVEDQSKPVLNASAVELSAESAPVEDQSEIIPVNVSTVESSAKPAPIEMDKHPVIIAEIPVVDKTVVEEAPVSQSNNEKLLPSTSKAVDSNYEDDGDDWLKEETSETGGTSIQPLGNDEDVSFSDLEEDDDGDVPVTYKKVSYSSSDSSAKDTRDWVRL